MVTWPILLRCLMNDRRAATAFECALVVAFVALLISGALTVASDY